MPVYTSHVTSSGGIQVTGSVEFTGIASNASTIRRTTKLPPNHNAKLYGPITVAADKVLNIRPDAKLKIEDI